MVLRLYTNVVTSFFFFFSLRKANLSKYLENWVRRSPVCCLGVTRTKMSSKAMILPTGSSSGYSVSWKWRDYMAVGYVVSCKTLQKPSEKKMVWHKTWAKRRGKGIQRVKTCIKEEAWAHEIREEAPSASAKWSQRGTAWMILFTKLWDEQHLPGDVRKSTPGCSEFHPKKYFSMFGISRWETLQQAFQRPCAIKGY